MGKLYLLIFGLVLLWSCNSKAQETGSPVPTAEAPTEPNTEPSTNGNDTVTESPPDSTNSTDGTDNTEGGTEDNDGDTDNTEGDDTGSDTDSDSDDNVVVTVNDEVTFFDPPVPCTSDNPTECADLVNSKCLANNASEYQCACDEGFATETEGCIKPIALTMVCEEGKSRCITPNSKCVYDSDGAGTKRCLCTAGYLEIKSDENTICAQILTKDRVEDCTECEENGGVCYGLNATTMESCRCPVSKIGVNCNETLVDVKCDVSTFTKHICYRPEHPGVDFERNGSEPSSMYANGKGSDVACIGKLLKEDSEFCKKGEVELILQLTAGKMEQCGTKELHPDISTRMFDTSIVISKKGAGGETVAFQTYCSFTKQTQSNFNGVAVNVIEGNSNGEHKYPNISFVILNYIGNEVADSVPIRKGDNVKYRISLVEDGTYTAARVERCMASSSPKVPDPKAVTEMLIQNSCPVAGNGIINATTNFRRARSSLAVLETGFFGMFKMTKGSSVFMHCSVKLCLKGKEIDCNPVDCGDHNGMGRRKRQTDQNTNVDIVKGVEVYEPGSGSMVISKTDFAVLITILVIMLLFFMVLAVLLYLKIRSRGPKVDDISLTEKPQRFALPRIRTPNMRM